MNNNTARSVRIGLLPLHFVCRYKITTIFEANDKQ